MAVTAAACLPWFSFHPREFHTSQSPDGSMEIRAEERHGIADRNYTVEFENSGKSRMLWTSPDLALLDFIHFSWSDDSQVVGFVAAEDRFVGPGHVSKAWRLPSGDQIDFDVVADHIRIDIAETDDLTPIELAPYSSDTIQWATSLRSGSAASYRERHKR